MRLHRCASVLVPCFLAIAPALRAQGVPATGLDLLRRMHDAYAGRWFGTLTFTQTTTRHRADGSDTVSTWYESLRQIDSTNTQLRIDIGDPAAGNGVLYTADSLWALRGGHLVAARAGGNDLLPLIEGVYLQPLSRTAAELGASAFDLQRPVLTARWNGRTVWIAGAASAADSSSPQFWVDAERLVLVRSVIAGGPPGAPPLDARLDSLVPLAGGWLATRCEFYVGGKLVQREEYHDWAANAPLAPALFDVAQWTTAPHWAHKAPGS